MNPYGYIQHYSLLVKVNRRRYGVFIVNFEHISYFFSSVSIADFEQVNVSRDVYVNN